MASQYIAQTPAAYGFPLLIKGLLESGVTRAPEQEIVSANQNRFTYRDFAERVGRLASGLASLGVERGDTVAIMDWDTHRYLECFFAVPMMGAVLHTVNVRLSPEQILYTINHAEDDVILINNGHQSFWLEDDHWRRDSAAGARPRSVGAWARRLRRLWHVGGVSHPDALRSDAENA